MAQFPEVGVQLVADGAGKYVAEMRGAESATNGLSGSIRSAAGMMGGFGQSLSRVGGLLTGGIALGVGALGAAFSAAAVTGFSFNNSMEQVEAQLFAFLKDGQAVADTLDMIKDRAARTPFEFEQMATAVTSLIPAAKQAGQPIEELIELAEILAASNPAEGLEGAAFSLREAMSGDFVSIVERFNLPRQRLNELKAEGVPALEAIRIAMSELGLDTDLVINLSQTLSGRWSTIKDVFTGLAATMTQPIFDAVSQGAGELITKLDALQPTFDQVGQSVANFVTNIMNGRSPLETINIAIKDFGRAFGLSIGEIKELRAQFTEFYTAATEQIAGIMAAIEPYTTMAAQFIADNFQMSDVIMGLGIAIGAFLLPVIGSLVVSIGTLLAPLLIVIGAVALVRTAWEQNWGGIQEKTAVALAFIQEVISAGLLFVQEFWAAHGETIIATVTTFLTNVQTFVSEALAAIQAFWQENGDSIIATVTALWNWVSEMFAAQLAFLLGVVAAGLQLIAGDWEGALETMKTVVTTAWETIKTLWGEAIDAIQGYVSSVDWGAVGSAIMQGIANGISAGAQWIADAATAAAQAALDAAKALLGISSPSKVFMEVGMNIGEGMALGIDAMKNTVSGASGSLAEAALRPVATPAQINNISYAKNTTVNFTGNYSSAPQINDSSSLTRVMAGYA